MPGEALDVRWMSGTGHPAVIKYIEHLNTSAP